NSLVFFGRLSGTSTYSLWIVPYCSQSVVLYFFRNESRSAVESRRASLPVLVRKLNMWPFKDVYGMVAPLRATRGFVATSFSYNSSARVYLPAGVSSAALPMGSPSFVADD